MSLVTTVISIQDLSLQTIGPESPDEQSVALSAKGQMLEMNLQALASANNGDAVFVTHNTMTVIHIQCVNFYH